MITSKVFDEQYPDIKEYTLQSDELIVKVINLGATITSIQYRSDGRDVVLGYDHIDDYLRFDNYFGATIGRCANRIKNGTFSLHGEDYHLDINDACNSLHGGVEGFHARRFHANINKDTLELSYFSKDMEEGYPGNLNFMVSFRVEKSHLHISYHARSDQDTIVNFTNHSYFALQGQGEGTVDHQILMMHADRYAVNDENRLVSGELREVKDTPFDFMEGKPIGQDIARKEDIQIAYANGYDHFFRFAKDQPHIVRIQDTKTKHTLTIKTDMPGFHFYVPDYEPAQKGKYGASYEGHCALCIETSFMPDAIHVQSNPETLLKADTPFTSETIYTFE